MRKKQLIAENQELRVRVDQLEYLLCKLDHDWKHQSTTFVGGTGNGDAEPLRA